MRFFVSIIFPCFVFFSAASVLSGQEITPDSEQDQTAMIQSKLDALALLGGGTFKLEAGFYTLKGSLTIPTGVCLEGVWSAAHHGILTKGTVLRGYHGRGKEDGPALLEMQQSSAIKGVTILYPEQTIDNVQPYPWSIHGRGMHNTIENVTLVNSYQGIGMGPEWNELHIIRNVFGCVLRRGIRIDNCTDIGRVENVHFNPHYWVRSGHEGINKQDDSKPSPSIVQVMQSMLEALTFARTDWEYVTNTFVYAAKIGYYFTANEQGGACNGQFLGIGADMSQYCVVADRVQPYGILITNGEFVAGVFNGEEKETIGIHTTSAFNGSLQLSNCSFWNQFTNVMKLEGDGFVSVSQASLLYRPIGPAIDIVSGKAYIKGVMFKSVEKTETAHIRVGEAVKKVIVSENFAEGGLRIDNKSGDKLTAENNE
jgi:hypothetical protein